MECGVYMTRCGISNNSSKLKQSFHCICSSYTSSHIINSFISPRRTTCIVDKILKFAGLKRVQIIYIPPPLPAIIIAYNS